MAFTPLTFTGASQFSSDLQTILTRAVQIAQLPVTALQNKESDILQRKALLGGLGGAVGGLADSLKALGTTAANQAVTASSSNSAAVSVTATGADTPGTYVVNSVTSVAAAASERSSLSYVDSAATAVSSTGSLRLNVGGSQYDFTLSNNTLVGLRDKINALGAGVTASILTTSNGNYLSVSSSTTGVNAITLHDDPSGANTNLLTADNPGTNAVFKLNGIDISQAGNVVNSVVPGLTFTLLGASAAAVTLSLASDRNQLSSALQTFVSNFNQVRTQLNAQVGAAAGLLSGNPLVGQLQSILRRITSYQGTGSIRSLADLGVELSNGGVASLNSTKFSALSSAQVTAGFSFLGSASSGLGGFSRTLQQFSDPISGLIKTEQNGVDRTDRNLQTQIAALTDRITIMQSNMALRLQKADALLASLQSQQQSVAASLQGLNLVLYGKSANS